VLSINDPENTIDWQIGDIVIHDADSKTERMLMRVVGFNRKSGLIRSVYVHQGVSKEIYENEKKYLHNPRHYGLEGGGHQ
jgi:hypothetical protein